MFTPRLYDHHLTEQPVLLLAADAVSIVRYAHHAFPLRELSKGLVNLYDCGRRSFQGNFAVIVSYVRLSRGQKPVTDHAVFSCFSLLFFFILRGYL